MKIDVQPKNIVHSPKLAFEEGLGHLTGRLNGTSTNIASSKFAASLFQPDKSIPRLSP
jgi:hypothetical protein